MKVRSVVSEAPVGRSFDDVFMHEFASISLIAGTIAGDRSIGDDLAQEAFRRAYQRWEKVSQFDRPGAWVRRVAINLALSRRRKTQRERRAAVRLAGERPLAWTDTPRSGDPEVWAAIDQLAPRQRAAIVLRYVEQRSIKEIAELLSCSASTASSTLHDGRKRLAGLLGGVQ